ncbi:hypothetical protein D3C85_1317990 [compost metagenome]
MSGDDVRQQFVERLDMPRTGGNVGKARVLRKVGPVDGDEEIAPVEVCVGHQADMSIGRLAGPAPGSEHARVAGLARFVGQVPAVVMLDQRIGRHAFEHGHLQLLAESGA